MKKELTIIVVGKANTGKSTMLIQLEKLLIENGYDVELSPKDYPDYSGDNAFHFRNSIMKNFNERVNAIKPNIKIILKEMQANREPISKENKND